MQLKFFVKIHHNYSHYITIEIFCDHIFAILNICEKNRKNISSQINSSLQHTVYTYATYTVYTYATYTVYTYATVTYYNAAY